MVRKLLMASAAMTVVAAATPAVADGVELEIGGYFSGYALYTDQDEPTGTEYRNFDFRKDVELTFSGETTLDNGLTVGAFIETNMDREDNTTSNIIEQSYMYTSGGWGRVNFGEANGAAYLLQVAAPSADANIDGFNPEINTFDLDTLTSSGGVTTGDFLGYALDITGYTTKLSYFTPVMNGFQAGVTFTPAVSEADQSGLAGITVNNNNNQYDYAYEIAARYEGEFEGVGITTGAGYFHGEREATTAGNEDRDAWNAGIDLDFAAFGLGVAYLHDDNGVATDGDTSILVVGADYVTGPYTFGVSYYDREDEAAATAVNSTGSELDTTRYTGGVSYSYGPGMDFRGSIAYIESETAAAGDVERDAYQIAVGTVISF